MNRKGFYAAAVMLVTVLCLAACSSKPETPEDTSAAVTTKETMQPVALTTAAAAETEEPETPEAAPTEEESTAEESESTEEETSEEETTEAELSTREMGNGLTCVERTGVYRLQYDASMFEFQETKTTDTLEYIGDKLLPVYVSVQIMKDMPADALAYGLVQQSGRDDVQIVDSNFGNEVPSKSIYMETDVNGVTQIQLYHVVENGPDSILVEVGSYVNGDEVLDGSIETILGTFELLSGAE